jgi:ATP-dependent Clp protease ATP-binding subunit ClpC
MNKNASYSARAQEAFQLMCKEALRLESNKVGSEHFILAMLTQPESGLGRVITRLGIQPNPLKGNLETIARLGGTGKRIAEDAIESTEELELAINMSAVYEADIAKSEKVEPEHVLLGILHEAWRGSPCTQVMTQYKITYDTAKRELFDASSAR